MKKALILALCLTACPAFAQYYNPYQNQSYLQPIRQAQYDLQQKQYQEQQLEMQRQQLRELQYIREQQQYNSIRNNIKPY